MHIIFILIPFIYLSQTWADDSSSLASVRNAIESKVEKWKISHFDKTPDVVVDGNSGYRIILQREDIVPVPSPEQQLSAQKVIYGVDVITSYSYIEIVLFPDNENVPEGLRERIAWKNLEPLYYTRAGYWGKGYGYHWFGRTTIFWQHHLREKFGLAGGENTIQLAADGLRVKDKDNMTRNSCIGVLRSSGETAVPYIEKVLQSNDIGDPWHCIYSLGDIQGESSTNLLRKLYASNDTMISRPAAYALVHKPYRESAKGEYFDMLKKRWYVSYCAQACAEFGWKDAMPLLQEICDTPHEWWYEFRPVFDALRILEGNPLPEEIKKAEETIRGSAFSKNVIEAEVKNISAKTTIINYSDSEYKAVIGVCLVLYKAKGGHEIANRIGKEILQTLPVESVRKVFTTLIKGEKDKWDKEEIEKALKEVLH